MKLNFDGSSHLNSKSGSIGGVFRNSEGHFVLGYYACVRLATNSVAKLMASMTGLNIGCVWDGRRCGRGYRSCFTQDARHTMEIDNLINIFTEFQASHAYRHVNKVADRLARMAYRESISANWKDMPPKEILNLFAKDYEESIE